MRKTTLFDRGLLAAITVLASAASASGAQAQDRAAVTDAEGRVFDAMPAPPAPPPVVRAAPSAPAIRTISRPVVQPVAPAMRPPAAPRDLPPVDTRPVWKEPGTAPHGQDSTYAYEAEYARQRDEWLAECRQRMGHKSHGGAVIGGLFGGLFGNRIAGRHDRTFGTIAGAAVGAVAGNAIDRAHDRNRAADACEAYLDRYYAQQPAYGAPGYGYQGSQPAYGYPGYAPGYTMTYAVPMMMVPVAQPTARPCRERVVVTETWVNVPVRRAQPRRAPVRHAAPDKRLRMK